MAINVREVERDQLFLMPPALPPRALQQPGRHLRGDDRGRGRNVAWVVDRTGLVDAENAFAAAIARPANALCAHAVRAQLRGGAPEPPVDDAAQRMIRRLDRLQEQKQPVRGLSL